ncbi:hypothetical protein CANARDRAFT_184539, partial [[Candida] arabinofermentans NRRL YB-2248]
LQYIDEFDIELVNQALTFDTADAHIQGTCDLFTTKPIGSDRKLYKTLDKLYSNTSASKTDSTAINDNDNSKSRTNSDASLSPILEPTQDQDHFTHHTYNTVSISATDDPIHYSPFGPLFQQSSRRILAYIIAILNSTFPDHDFSTVQPTNFSSIPSPSELIYRINSLLISLGKSNNLDWIWQTINTHMDLEDCLCFTYEPEQSFLNDLNSSLWCNMYFIYNKKKKRVAFIYLSAMRLMPNDTNARRNSKLGTLDEDLAAFDETQEEWDLRYAGDDERNGVTYEDVFDEEDDDVLYEDEDDLDDERDYVQE